MTAQRKQTNSQTETTPKTPKEIEQATAMSGDEFASMIDQEFGVESALQGKVATGRIVGLEKDLVVVDVGLKSEGRIPLKEFGAQAVSGDAGLNVGDNVEVFVERYENVNGEVELSRERARREEAWIELEQAHEKAEHVTGTIFHRVKGGFMVDIAGAVAFLPNSQVDIRPVKDIGVLMDTPQPFMILKMDKKRSNIVVSRRAILEESRAEARDELADKMREGLVLEGVVKNITDYGAFIDLGGLDGLLHLTDISWKRINHPSEALELGQTIEVQVIKFNEETGRISLGMKQLEDDPWQAVEQKYPVGVKFTGRVTNITDYGAFVEIEDGIEGLVHVSEMSWTRQNVHPGKVISTSEEVEVMVLEVDIEKRRISLGLKQCQSNPWDSFADNNPVGTELDGEVKNITDFGLFLELPGGLDGMVHASDLSWEGNGEALLSGYEKGQKIKVKVLDIDQAKQRISLGVKQMEEDPFSDIAGDLQKGQIVTCTITALSSGGVEVETQGLQGFIKKGELARERSEQRTDRFATGEKVDALILKVDRGSRKLQLSIKAKEVAEEKEAMAEYGSADSGAQLGEILGGVLGQAKQQVEAASKAKAEKKPAEKKTAEKKADADDEADDGAKAEKKPAAKKAPAKKATTKKAVDDKADEKKPAAKKAAPKKAAAKASEKKPAAKKPAAKKTTAKKAAKDES